MTSAVLNAALFLYSFIYLAGGSPLQPALAAPAISDVRQLGGAAAISAAEVSHAAAVLRSGQRMAAGSLLRTGTAFSSLAPSCTYCILAAVVALPVCVRRHASRSSLIAVFPSSRRSEGPCRGRCLPASLLTCRRHGSGLAESTGRTPATAPPGAEPSGSRPSCPNSSRLCLQGLRGQRAR